MSKFDNKDAKHMLLAIRRMALAPYPFPEDATIDPRYCMALGLIAGISIEAVQAVMQNRQASFKTKE